MQIGSSRPGEKEGLQNFDRQLVLEMLRNLAMTNRAAEEPANRSCWKPTKETEVLEPTGINRCICIYKRMNPRNILIRLCLLLWSHGIQVPEPSCRYKKAEGQIKRRTRETPDKGADGVRRKCRKNCQAVEKIC